MIIADITNGIVYEVKTSDDLQAFINTAPTQKYAVVMPQTMLTRLVLSFYSWYFNKIILKRKIVYAER